MTVIDTETKRPLIHLILIAVGLTMGVVSIVFNVLDMEAQTTIFLAIGLTTLALHQLMKHKS